MAPPIAKSFPIFKSFARLNSLAKANEATEFYDCKFYPYTEPGVDPVFAVVGGAESIVCRPCLDDAGIEVLAWFHEESSKASLNSCVWSVDLESGDPLLCVAGDPGIIKIFNVRSKSLIKTLIGHGGAINDLAVSPLSPEILASASVDYSVRFWSLNAAHQKQPCMLICGGEGHKQGLLTFAFHGTGQYILTGGLDCAICLWVIPALPNETTGTDKPTILHYPHFSTSAVHTNVVDCIQWHGDLILSKGAGEYKIVLWRIEDFDSIQGPPTRAPTTHEFRPTRSAYRGTYQRLLEFDAAETTPFYMRFSVFNAPSERPILVIGNEKSRVFFWDLQCLEEWDRIEVESAHNAVDKEATAPKARRGSKRTFDKRAVKQGEGDPSSTSRASGLVPVPALSIDEDHKTGQMSKSAQQMSVGNPFQPLAPHAKSTVPRISFTARQVAWSVGGEWMVVTGTQGIIALFAR